jgi:hypothetical protein
VGSLSPGVAQPEAREGGGGRGLQPGGHPPARARRTADQVTRDNHHTPRGAQLRRYISTGREVPCRRAWCTRPRRWRCRWRCVMSRRTSRTRRSSRASCPSATSPARTPPSSARTRPTHVSDNRRLTEASPICAAMCRGSGCWCWFWCWCAQRRRLRSVPSAPSCRCFWRITSTTAISSSTSTVSHLTTLHHEDRVYLSGRWADLLAEWMLDTGHGCYMTSASRQAQHGHAVLLA